MKPSRQSLHITTNIGNENQILEFKFNSNVPQHMEYPKNCKHKNERARILKNEEIMKIK